MSKLFNLPSPCLSFWIFVSSPSASISAIACSTLSAMRFISSLWERTNLDFNPSSIATAKSCTMSSRGKIISFLTRFWSLMKSRTADLTEGSLIRLYICVAVVPFTPNIRCISNFLVSSSRSGNILSMRASNLDTIYSPTVAPVPTFDVESKLLILETALFKASSLLSALSLSTAFISIPKAPSLSDFSTDLNALPSNSASAETSRSVTLPVSLSYSPCPSL